MYYSKINESFTGFTNQIFALTMGIISAYKQGEKVVIVDEFIRDISKKTYTPITNIFNITDINYFLKINYDIIIVDKKNINFELLSITYGIDEKNIDLTSSIKDKYFKDGKLFINKDCCFNDIKGDPCPEVSKKLIIKYIINDYYIEEIYEENLKTDIIFDFDSVYKCDFGWPFGSVDSFNDNMFEKILTNIKYSNDLVSKSEFIKKQINTNKKINVIHLRLEDDGLDHWSRMNNIGKNEYKTILEQKYIDLIKSFLSQNDETIILSHSFSNGVIDYLKQNNYKYKFINKFFSDREKNAIVDFLVSNYCNNFFIGNFNFKDLRGSSFSYYIGKSLKNDVIKIYIDLDKIFEPAAVA
jgi:hypothetical protein